ncbi:hypothetical protein CMO96_03395 [Candidatus Woesebacteria bacterium]|nr:hypothetical protein [Candidatus Woesebacteria bacterium]
MQPTNTSSLIRWWVTPKLPIRHIFIDSKDRPNGIFQAIRVYFRKWVIHPIRRWTAHYYVRFLQKFYGLVVIGLTGSAGKTSTKEMIVAILQRQGETVWTHANEDPVFNIPTTIFRCKPATRYLVLEMGVEFPGEMAFYLWLAQPSMGVITNVHQTHTEFFGDREGVAKEKGVLVRSLGKSDAAILNKENRYTQRFAKSTKAKVTWFGKGGDIQAKNIEIKDLKSQYTLMVDNKDIQINLPILGEQFVSNSLAAAAVGWVSGASLNQIKQGLEEFKPAEHRMRPIKLRNGSLVLDDSYNSNPAAAKKALETFKEVAGKEKKIVVLGDMLELGTDEVTQHKKLGKLVQNVGTDYLVGVGKLAKHAVGAANLPKGHSWWATDQKEILPILKPLLKKNTVVLIKGSRSIELDKLVDQLAA